MNTQQCQSSRRLRLTDQKQIQEPTDEQLLEALEYMYLRRWAANGRIRVAYRRFASREVRDTFFERFAREQGDFGEAVRIANDRFGEDFVAKLLAGLAQVAGIA